MAHSPAVLLLDDGELDDVQQTLDELGVEFARIRGGAIVPDTPPPTQLLVTTPRRIEALGELDPDAADELVRIVVVREDSPTLRSKVREIGFDYLVRRPVHPEALRLLLVHSLYRGEERRREPRIAVGFEVSFKIGLIPRKATLVDLSTRGCRLLSPYALEPGKRVRVQIPESLGATESLNLEGRVLRMKFDERLGTEGLYSAAVVFEELPPDVRNELEWIIEDKSQGPPTLQTKDGGTGEWLDTDPDEEDDPADKPRRSGAARKGRRRIALRETVSPNYKPDPRSEGGPASPPRSEAATSSPLVSRESRATEDAAEAPTVSPLEAESSSPTAAPRTGAREEGDAEPDRREKPRRAWDAKVPAFGTRALRVLVGRDLSVGGMRIAPNPELEVGERLHLAIYGEAGDEPFLVWGTVVRDDGDDGMGLAFDEVHPVIGEQLEKLVANLPTVESLADDELGALGTVMTQILD